MDVNAIRALMEKGVSQGVFPGAVLLCAVGENVLFHEAFGVADIFSGTRVQKQSIFDLASLTKPLATALSIERLTEQHPGLFQYRIGDLLDPFADTDKDGITVDMLLRHTSGYPAHREYFRQIEAAGSTARQMQTRLLVGQDLENPAGTTQVYSDLGYMILSRVVEKLSGLSLDRYSAQMIYHPLKVERLFFIPAAAQPELFQQYGDLFVPTQKCRWRNRLLKGEVDDENAWAVGGVDGHAGLFGDAFSVYMLCRQILAALHYKTEAFFDPHIIKGMVTKKEGFERVAGFDTPSIENSSAGRYLSSSSIGHLGFTGTSFWIDPASGLIVILLTNRIHPSRANEKIRQFRPKIHDLIAAQLT